MKNQEPKYKARIRAYNKKRAELEAQGYYVDGDWVFRGKPTPTNGIIKPEGKIGREF